MIDAVTFFRGLADETRWRIVRLVMERALCVCELADILEMPQSSVSSHVQIIRKADLLEEETCGKWVYFRIRDDRMSLLQTAITQLGETEIHAIDADRTDSRLAHRKTSCCPGPIKLAGRRPSSTATLR